MAAAATADSGGVTHSVRINENALFTSKVIFEREQYALVLYRDRLSFFPTDSSTRACSPVYLSKGCLKLLNQLRAVARVVWWALLAFAIFLEDVYGATLNTVTKRDGTAHHDFVIHTFVPKGRDRTRGDPRHGVDPDKGRANEYYIRALTQPDQVGWVNHIFAALRGLSVEERKAPWVRSALVVGCGVLIGAACMFGRPLMAVNTKPRRRFYVVINPFGGAKKAPKIYKSTVCVVRARPDRRVRGLTYRAAPSEEET